MPIAADTPQLIRQSSPAHSPALEWERRRSSLHDPLASLATCFPVTRQLVGAERFRALGRELAQRELGNAERVVAYFPSFIASVGAVASAPFIGDLARLELACRRAGKAPEVRAIKAARLPSPTSFPHIKVRLHPALSVVRSRYPIVSIWEAYRDPRRAPPVQNWEGETALISRVGNSARVRRLPPGGCAFITSLAREMTIAEAIGVARDEFVDFGGSDMLALLHEAQTIVAYRGGETPVLDSNI